MLAPTPNVIVWPDAATFTTDMLHALSTAFRAAGYTLALRELAIDDQVAWIDSPEPTRAVVTVPKTGRVRTCDEPSPVDLARNVCESVDAERFPDTVTVVPND